MQNKNQFIAELAIKCASDAMAQFPDADEGALRVHLAAALVKATTFQDVFNRLFPPFDNPIVDRLFTDDVEAPDIDALVWELV